MLKPFEIVATFITQRIADADSDAAALGLSCPALPRLASPRLANFTNINYDFISE